MGQEGAIGNNGHHWQQWAPLATSSMANASGGAVQSWPAAQQLQRPQLRPAGPVLIYERARAAAAPAGAAGTATHVQPKACGMVQSQTHGGLWYNEVTHNAWVSPPG